MKEAVSLAVWKSYWQLDNTVKNVLLEAQPAAAYIYFCISFTWYMDIVDCMLVQSYITAYCAFSRILKILDLYGLMENLSRWEKLNFAVNS